jgi:hypothetical protein
MNSKQYLLPDLPQHCHHEVIPSVQGLDKIEADQISTIKGVTLENTGRLGGAAATVTS